MTLLVESNTTILVRWLPPENENGIIIGYRIQLRELEMNSSERIVNVSGEANSTLVNLLKPYTNYTFRMQAWTSVGLGNFSETETARTHEGCMCLLILYYYTINFVLFILIILHEEFRKTDKDPQKTIKHFAET